MKKYTLLLLIAPIILLFAQCTSDSSVKKRCAEKETRAEIISELVNNHAYMSQLMDSMVDNKHGMMIASHSSMRKRIMQNLLNMCHTDTMMCKMMMGKCMEMCDKDTQCCEMMLSCMKEHPLGVKQLKGMGMCTMNDSLPKLVQK